MGSIGMHREKGLTDREFFQTELSAHHEILACSSKQTSGEWQRVFYAAVRDTRTGEVWALVVPFSRYRGHTNFFFKTMDETCGPFEADAPAAILDLLTPTDHEYAAAWREKCRANLDREAARVKPKRGDTVRFDHELHFSDGSAHTELTFQERTTFVSSDGYRFRIPGWTRYGHTVLTAQ